MKIWNTLLLGEQYLKENPERFHGHVLLVGIKGKREQAFCEKATLVTAVEPWAPNAKIARELYPGAAVVEAALQDYVLQCTQRGEWPDIVVWLQGPEHVPKKTALHLLETLRRNTSLVLAEMPHGKHVQGADGGNPYEEHQAYLYAVDFNEDIWDIALSYDTQVKEDLVDPNGVRHLLVATR